MKKKYLAKVDRRAQKHRGRHLSGPGTPSAILGPRSCHFGFCRQCFVKDDAPGLGSALLYLFDNDKMWIVDKLHMQKCENVKKQKCKSSKV